jgi:hypothetical protein
MLALGNERSLRKRGNSYFVLTFCPQKNQAFQRIIIGPYSVHGCNFEIPSPNSRPSLSEAFQNGEAVVDGVCGADETQEAVRGEVRTCSYASSI